MLIFACGFYSADTLPIRLLTVTLLHPSMDGVCTLYVSYYIIQNATPYLGGSFYVAVSSAVSYSLGKHFVDSLNASIDPRQRPKGSVWPPFEQHPSGFGSADSCAIKIFFILHNISAT